MLKLERVERGARRDWALCGRLVKILEVWVGFCRARCSGRFCAVRACRLSLWGDCEVVIARALAKAPSAPLYSCVLRGRGHAILRKIHPTVKVSAHSAACPVMLGCDHIESRHRIVTMVGY